MSTFNLFANNFHFALICYYAQIECNKTDDENLNFRRIYSGTDLPRTSLRYNCPVVTLKFFADSSVSGEGFSIEYTVIG